MAHSTLKATLLDRLHDQNADRETRFIEAQEAARAVSRELCVADVLTTYLFTPYEFRTFSTAGGKLLQASMLIENPNDVNDRFIVTCNTESGEAQWSVQCPPFKSELGPVFISAMIFRLASNSQARRLQEGS